jgi:hypothetical protein
MVTHHLFRGGVWRAYASSVLFFHTHILLIYQPTYCDSYLPHLSHHNANIWDSQVTGQTFTPSQLKNTCQAVISIHTNEFLEPSAGHQICSDTLSSPLSRVELHIILPKRSLGIHREPHILRPSHSLGESPVRLSTAFYISFSSTMGIAHAK